MAEIVYRGNLKAASFPFLSEAFGRSVIVRGQDHNYVSGLAAKESLDSTIGVPQIYYCHNVIPTDHGYRSVSYHPLVDPAYSAAVGFEQTVVLRNAAGESATLATDASGNCYILPSTSTAWISPLTPPAPASIAGKHMTVAYVSGVSYIYFANVGCWVYDFTTNTLTATTLTGLTASAILGVVGNLGYLLAYSTDAISWSSTIDPTDFTPSLATGAGGGQVEGLRGTIVTVVEIFGGMVIFATDNAVAVKASGNPRFPYNFHAVPGAGGLINPNYATSDTGAGTVYAYTKSGVQAITLTGGATLIFPEVTDFLSGSYFEDYNEVTDELETTDAAGVEVKKRITLISDRYLIVSYGIGALTHALFYDAGYKQWGRLKFNHTNCFEINEHPSTFTELPRKSIAFLTSGGGVTVLDMDIENSDANGVMLLGKFQYVRNRTLQLQGVEFENVDQGVTFSLGLLPSLDGKNFQPIVSGCLSQSTGKFREYKFHTTALNHTLVCKGAFNAVSFQMKFNVAGKR